MLQSPHTKTTGYWGIGRLDYLVSYALQCNGSWTTNLLGVQSIVQAQAAHCPHILGSKWCQETSNVGGLVRHLVITKDVSLNDVRIASLGDICHSFREDGISVKSAAVLGEEANETLLNNVRLFFSRSQCGPP